MRGEQLNVEDGTKVKCSCYGDVRYIYDDDYAKKVEELWDEWYRYQIHYSISITIKEIIFPLKT